MNQFKSAAITRNRIEKLLKEVDYKNPMSIGDIYPQIPEAKNLAQVSDSVKVLHHQGKLMRIREGKAYKYWANSPLGHGVPPVNLCKKEMEKVVKEASARTEVRVEENRIIIEHPKCRVVVDLL